MRTYEEMTKECGALGAALYYDNCLVRDGKDIVALYRKDETLRWTPDGELIVTAVMRDYSQYAKWDNRFGYMSDCYFVSKKTSMRFGRVFTFTFSGNTHETLDRLSIDIATRRVTVLDPPLACTIKRADAKRALDRATEVLRAAAGTSKLMDEPADPWLHWGVLRKAETVAQHIADEAVGILATAFAAYPGEIKQLDRILERCKPHIYRHAGAIVPAV